MPRLFEQIFFYNNLLSQLVSDTEMNIQLVGKTADTCQQLYASGVFLRGAIASDPKKNGKEKQRNKTTTTTTTTTTKKRQTNKQMKSK